jgi:hypothetical protein
MTEFKNYTPHTITIYGAKLPMVLPSEGCARIETKNISEAQINEVPLKTVLHSNEVTGLPEPKAGVYYIVSLFVALAAPERQDLVCPGKLVRNKGYAMGCEGLVRPIRLGPQHRITDSTIEIEKLVVC